MKFSKNDRWLCAPTPPQPKHTNATSRTWSRKKHTTYNRCNANDLRMTVPLVSGTFLSNDNPFEFGYIKIANAKHARQAQTRTCR